MPLTLREIHDLNDPATREEIKSLYDRSPEFSDGDEAIKQLELALAQGGTLYLGMFNDRPIAGIWSMPSGPEERTLQYIIVHPANRGRGIAEQLCELVTAEEVKKDHVEHFKPGCGAIRRTLQNINRL